MSVSPTDKTLALVPIEDTSTILLKGIDGHLIRSISVGVKVKSLSWSRNGQILLSLPASDAVNDKNIATLYSMNGDFISTLNVSENDSSTEGFLDVHALSPQGDILATVDSDHQSISLWNKAGILQKRWSRVGYQISTMSWSPDGKTLAIGDKFSGIQLLSADGNIRKKLPSPNVPAAGSSVSDQGTISELAWSSDGEGIAASGIDKTIQIWGREGNLETNLPGHSGEVIRLSWSGINPQSDYGGYKDSTLLSSSTDGTIKLWRFMSKGWTLVKTIKTSENSTVGWASDGNAVISLGDDKRLHIWKLDGAVSKIAEPKEPDVGPKTSPDGNLFLSRKNYEFKIKSKERVRMDCSKQNFRRRIRKLPDGFGVRIANY
jgi:WD40 repeat protein